MKAMRRRAVLLLTAMVAALILASGVVLAESQLDQQQTLADGGFAVVDDTTTNQLGQTFTAGVTGALDKVSLYVGCCADASGNIGGTIPGYGLVVTVHSVDSSSGLPNSSSYYGLGEVPAANFSTDGSLGWVDIPLNHYCVLGDCNGIISAGQQYAIVLDIDHGQSGADTSSTTSTSGYQWGRTTPSAYSAGMALSRDTNGTWHAQDQFDFAFKTYVDASSDTTPPTVDSVAPRDGAMGVDRDKKIRATFSEAMDPSTINTSTATLVNRDTGQKIDAVVSYDASTNKVTLDPSARLVKYTHYRARIEGAGDTDNLAVRDLAGNELATDYTWTFKTGRS